jgi:predicted DNA binding protein
MWVLKLRFSAKKQFLGQLAEKHGVSLTGYALSHWKDKKWLYLEAAGFMFGEEKNKKSFLKDIKGQKELVKMEYSKGFIIAIIKQPLFTEAVYNPKIINLTPVVINKNGYHEWHLASFDRKILVRLLNVAEKYWGAAMISFGEERVSNISFTQLLPELTPKQRKAMEIAINSGYYKFPKEATMEELAKKMNIGYSTYQAHLKKAEGKLLPNIFERL